MRLTLCRGATFPAYHRVIDGWHRPTRRCTEVGVRLIIRQVAPFPAYHQVGREWHRPTRRCPEVGVRLTMRQVAPFPAYHRVAREWHRPARRCPEVGVRLTLRQVAPFPAYHRGAREWHRPTRRCTEGRAPDSLGDGLLQLQMAARIAGPPTHRLRIRVGSRLQTAMPPTHRSRVRVGSQRNPDEMIKMVDGTRPMRNGLRLQVAVHLLRPCLNLPDLASSARLLIRRTGVRGTVSFRVMHHQQALLILLPSLNLTGKCMERWC